MTSGPGSAAGPVAGLTTSTVLGAFHQGNLHVLLHPAWPLFRPAASPARPGLFFLCVPKTSSESCDQAIFVDQGTGASLFPDTVLAEINRLG